MAKTRRRTRRTDSNGALKDVYKGSWERQYLNNARRLGMPERLLDPAGSDDWRETGSVLGLWAEWVYVLSDCMRGIDHLGNERRDNLGIVEAVFTEMVTVARGLGLDPETPGLIPWDAWYIRRELSPQSSTEQRTAAEIEAVGDARAAHAEAYDGLMAVWGCPSGSGHDSHGHGLGNGHWACLPEESK